MEASIIESMEDSITEWWHTASVSHVDKRGARLEEIAGKWISRRRPHTKISELMPHILPILERLRAAYLLHLPENWASSNSWVGPCEAEVENNRRDKKRWEDSHGKLPKPAEAAAKDARAQVAATIRALATVHRTAPDVVSYSSTGRFTIAKTATQDDIEKLAKRVEKWPTRYFAAA